MQADVGGMVDEALEASRSGSIFSRVAATSPAGEEDAQVSAARDLRRGRRPELVARVQKSVNRKAQDAEVDFPSLEQVKERTGIAVKTAAAPSSGSTRR